MTHPHRVRFPISIALWAVLAVTFVSAGCQQQEPAEKGLCPVRACAQ